MGHPQKYMGGLLHNAYEAGEKSHSPKVKLPLAFVDSMVYLFLLDCCVQPYWDWTTYYEDRPAPAQDRGSSWILDPKECPKLVHPDPGSAGLGSTSLGAENGSWKRKNRKKHRRRLRSKLKVTNHGEGKDSPVWSHGGPGSRSESSASGVDSGFISTQKQQGVNTTGATIVKGDRTTLLSPATIKKLDARDYNNDPLSDHLDYKPSDDNQEMAIVEERSGTIVGDG